MRLNFKSGALAVAMSCTAAQVGNAANELHLTRITADNQIVKPTYVTAAPGDRERIFVCEQWRPGGSTGFIHIIKRGVLQAQPFLSLPNVSTANSGGLLCMAFAPDYADSGTFYVKYTDAGDDLVVSRFQVSANPDVANAASEEIIIRIDQPSTLHNGGWIGFGPDGLFYISVGDGGPTGDPDRRGQDTNSLLAKMLRIDVSGDDFPADPLRNYRIPADNPFVGGPQRAEIWAYGLREPWRCSFDRATGDFYIADVGEELREEINFEAAGHAGGTNYGWRCREGTQPFMNDPECVGQTFVNPVFEYVHGGTPFQCSITGGYVYRGPLIAEMQGRYLFADFCTSTVWSVRVDGGVASDLRTHSLLVNGTPVSRIASITSFGEDACGEIYICTHFAGAVYKLTPVGGVADCNANTVPDPCEPDCNQTGVPDDCETITPGDFDADGEVTSADAAGLVECLAGPEVAPAPQSSECVAACLVAFDFDADGDIDLRDFAEFVQLEFGRSNQP